MEKIILNEIKRNLSLMGLTENQMEIEFNQNNNDKSLKDYIDIVDSEDDNPENLNIEFIQSNSRFAKLLNKLLFEIYKDNLDWNEDKSNRGIIDIYPLNDLTNWSILNYFGGHKFVKDRLLNNFKKENKGDTPKDFYNWLIENKEKLFKDGPILKELIRANMNTYNKGSITEKYVIEKLKNSKYKIKYFPPGSKQDKDHGIDLEINGKSFQIKELTGISEEDGKLILNTPLPKNYIDMKVENIMLVDINTGDYISFPNKNYKIDVENKCFILENKKIKKGNFNNL
jgi:hypothetical protein